MTIDSQTVRQLFGNVSRTAGGDFLWREAAMRLSDRLAVMKVDTDVVLDVGCGMGEDLAMLKACCPQAMVVGLDVAYAPLKLATNQNKAVECLCGNAESPLFKSESFNLIWSNMMLHWAEDIGAVLANWYETLRQDGLLIFSCLGYHSLHNLHQAFHGIDAYDHVLTFPDFQQLGDALIQSGFSAPVLEHEWIDVTYKSISLLLQDLRALGGNPLKNRRQGLFGKNAFAQLLQNLESLRGEDGQITLQFELIFAHAFKEIPQRRALDSNQDQPITLYR